MVYLTGGQQLKVFIKGLGDGTRWTLSMQMTQNQEEELTNQETLVTQQVGETNQQGSYEVQQQEMQVL